ncbi:hypothetical protein LJR016_005239 [Devosia sp. LjRoot16]|uniref:hypothetical protein n=1 Tax=Hyphomicrobiales TaxID=356 RepID=UPI003ED021FB
MEPQIKPTKLIVAMAFVRDEEGELRPAFEPREMQSEERAVREARLWAGAGQYAGTLAWSRTADLTNGVFGHPDVLFQWGAIPDME